MHTCMVGILFESAMKVSQKCARKVRFAVVLNGNPHFPFICATRNVIHAAVSIVFTALQGE
jgi:hypothetical protein